jgi:hypothetical protein
MIGSIISGTLGLAGGIYGAVKAGQERRKMEQFLSGQEAQNTAEYNKDFYGDYTQRADTQALIQSMRDQMLQRTKQAESTAAITGATPEAIAAERASQNKAMTDTYSRISAMGQAYKDYVSDQYRARRDQLSGLRYNEMEKSAQSYENLMSTGLGALGNALSMTPEGSAAADITPGAISTPKVGLTVTGTPDPVTNKNA